MKKFEDFKINEEWSEQDTEYLRTVVAAIQMRVPTFTLEFNELSGRVMTDNKVIFTSQGRETPSVISAYVNGYLFGLGKGLKLK